MGGIFDPKEEQQTQSTSVGPPEWAQPYVEDYIERADTLSRRPTSLYGGQFTPDMSSQRRAGLEGMYGLASGGGTGAVGNATGYLNDVLSGQYLSAPHLADAAQLSIDRMTPRVLSQYALSGRTGSGLAAHALGEGAGRATLDAYLPERQMQQQALSMAPAIESFAYDPYQRMQGVGGAYEADEQARINEARMRHDFAQNEPQQRLDAFGRSLGIGSRMWGREGTQEQTVYGPSPFQTAAGIGLTAAGVAGGMGWKPFSAAPGVVGNPPTQGAAAAGSMWNPYADPLWGF